MKKVYVWITFYCDGEIRHSSYYLQTESVNELFDNLLYDAHRLADNLKGKISFKRDDGSLYVNYLDVPETDKIDVLYSIHE